MADSGPDGQGGGAAGRAPLALPRLGGRGLQAFRLLWLIALAVAVAAPLGGAVLKWRRAAGAMEAASLAIDLLPPLLLVATAILLFLRRRADTVAALLSLSFLLMSAAFFASEGFFRALEMSWLRDLLAHLGRAALIVVLLTFPDGRFVPRWTVAVALLLLLWAPFAWLGPVSLDAEYVGYLAFMAVAVLSIALPYRRLPPGLERQQVRWVLFGFATGTILLVAATAITFLPDARPGAGGEAKTWAELAAQLLAALGIACFALGLMVSLLRYRLYDADAVISRSAAYAVLTLTLGAVFAASAKGVELFFETSFGRDSGAVPAAMAAGLAAVLVTPAHNRIHGWAERRFQKVLLHLRRDLPDCVEDLRETAGLQELLDEVLVRVEAGVRAVRSAVMIDGEVAAARGVEPAGLDPSSFPLAVPLRSGQDGAEIGTLLVGPRPDGSGLGRDEREALREVAGPVARAVKVVRLREAAERRTEARFAAIERRLAEVPPLPATEPRSTGG